MSVDVNKIEIEYDPVRLTGRLSRSEGSDTSFWERLNSKIIANSIESKSSKNQIEIPWTDCLGIIREFGSKSVQKSLNFRFKPVGLAVDKIGQFFEEFSRARQHRNTLTKLYSEKEVEDKLVSFGFVKRKLKSFQLRDIVNLLSMSNGANFSVPGAGKTTVTFALHLLVKSKNQHLFVVCPKSAFPAWRSIVNECMSEGAVNNGDEQFIVLDGDESSTQHSLDSGATRFVMTYDLMVRQQNTIAAYLGRNSVHLVLDEAHRMKAGLASQRGAFLIGVATLPSRKDILTGTPMPQSSTDLISQLSFLWPGHGYDLQIQRGTPPREVLGNLYVRTTKQELDLPKARRDFYQVSMAPGQLALYSVVRSEALRQLTKAIKKGRAPDYLSARKSVMRLLQISVNPTLALQGMVGDDYRVESGIVDAVLEEGISNKMLAVAEHVRQLALAGKKTVVWTIFTNSIVELESLLVDLNPVSIYGAIPSGSEEDLGSREGRLKRFHLDQNCKVLIANPAAAGEGISLHTVCHDAIYLDRSYVSTHYLQSIDRIHRLGLLPGTETVIHIYQSKAPASIGSIDLSVSRRLAKKIRGLQELLDDSDLHEIALDEEEADDPVDYSIDMQDLVDLVEELEGRGSPAEDEEP